MTVKDFKEHYCLAIYSQGQWKEGYTGKLRSGIKKRFLQLSGHDNCETCSTCPICRSLSELFDPKALGEYDLVCSLCKKLYNMLKAKLGQAQGIILLSHFLPISNELVERLFLEKNVKKVYVLNLKAKSSYEDHDKLLKSLGHKIISHSNYEFRMGQENSLLEIRRDEYTS